MVRVADWDHMAAGATLERRGSGLSDPFTSDRTNRSARPPAHDVFLGEIGNNTNNTVFNVNKTVMLGS